MLASSLSFLHTEQVWDRTVCILGADRTPRRSEEGLNSSTELCSGGGGQGRWARAWQPSLRTCPLLLGCGVCRPCLPHLASLGLDPSSFHPPAPHYAHQGDRVPTPKQHRTLDAVPLAAETVEVPLVRSRARISSRVRPWCTHPAVDDFLGEGASCGPLAPLRTLVRFSPPLCPQ